jgi:hypothetical protein
MPLVDKPGVNFFLSLCIKYLFVTIKLQRAMNKGIILLGLFAVLSASAQELKPVCGTSAADQHAFTPRLLANLAAVESGQVQDRGGVQYIPVHFHLVADASGAGRVREYKVLDQLCALNASYASIGIQFYLSPHPLLGLFDKTINNAGVYTTQTNSFLMNSKRHQNAINYYVVDVAASSNNNPGIVLAYYSPGQDWVVSRRDQINGNMNNSTIAHETGHFFSLQHPFLGWESTNGFGPSYPGWPIAPVLAPDGGVTERQDGTNCTVAADHICDTGPDYKFGFLQSNCAVYNGGAKDPLGVLVDPMENNTMSYFEACSTYLFTPLQSAAMLADLNTNGRNYLENTYAPVATSIDTPTDLLIAPASASTTQFYNAVALEWNAVPGATHYLVEVDVIPAFVTTGIKTYITTNTALLLTDLAADDTYYWRVRPFNYSVGCAAAKSRSFKTSSAISSTVDIEGLSAWQVSPNPVEGDHAHLTINATSAFDANVSIVDAAGKLVQHLKNMHFSEGASVVDLSLEGLANGFYFVRLDNGTARDVRKLVLAR